MPRTYTNLLLHAVFSTQGHLPLLLPEIRVELFPYMATLVKELKGLPLIINGVADHCAHAHPLAARCQPFGLDEIY